MTESSNWHTLDQKEMESLGSEAKAAGEPSEPVAQGGPHRHFPSWHRDPPEKERIGLALSGGGLRSATFNLGLLQKLHELKLLSAFDYLATVSGGGYIGGFWSAWRARDKEARSGSFPEKREQDPEAPEIRHLREFGNFLKPRLSLFSAETGRILAGVVGAVVPSVTISLAVLLLALGVWLGAACVLLGEFPRFWLPALGFASLTLVAHVLFELGSKGRLEQKASLARFEYRWWVGGSVALAFISWLVLWHVLPLPLEHLLQPVSWDGLGDEAALALLPSVAWLVVAVVLIVPRTLSSQHYSKDHSTRASKGALDRVIAQVLFTAGLWASGGIAWLGGQVLAAGGLGGLLTAVAAGAAGSGSFAWARSLLAIQPNKPSGGSLLARLQPWLPRILAYLTLTAAATGAVSLMILVHSRFGTSGLVILVGVGLFVVLVAVRSYHPHENGFHAFYRARLSRAFLGASNPCTADHPHAALECKGDDLFINALPEGKPLHLICCAANDLAGDELTTLHRGADSTVISRLGLQVGDRWEAWSGDREVPSLSSAITASGAAFNSHMGSISMRLGRITCFLFAALSLRLGLWLENPQAKSKRFRDLQRHRPGLLFLRELLGLSRSDASWIYLSDGAHFENLAFYELIRRHCRFIVVSDCGADPDVAFDDFGNAVRRVREDFGVEVDIDLSPLQSKDSRQPMVAGDIRYSEKDIGWLFYIKPTLVGNEPPDIAQYAQRNSDFPHETTLDQFYDEAQWEAYRRLGMHVAKRAFEDPCKENPESPSEQSKPAPIQTFLAARYEWRPIADEKSGALVKLEEQWGKLESRLADSDAKRLCAQVLTPTAARGKNRRKPPSDDDRVAALPLVREALRLMDATYHQSDMKATPYSPSHPRHRGILNRFGRWASAPLFRSWWRWLAPLHSHSLIRFLVEVFELPNPLEWQEEKEPQKKEDTRIKKLDKNSQGYALDRWEALKRDKNSTSEEDPTRVRFGFFVPMVDDGSQILMAGLVLLKRNTRNQKKTAEWSTQDFFIPPGLWGIKVSDAFLESLVWHFRKDPEVHELIVRIAEDSPNTATNALYTGAEFHREKRDLQNGDLKNTDPKKGDFFVCDVTRAC